MKIVSRNAIDQEHAYNIAAGMEESGVSVFSITHSGMYRSPEALGATSSFIVWGKHAGWVDLDKMDALIDMKGVR